MAMDDELFELEITFADDDDDDEEEDMLMMLGLLFTRLVLTLVDPFAVEPVYIDDDDDDDNTCIHS